MNRTTNLFTILSVSLLVAVSGYAEDWPTYRHDMARAGISSESLQLPLQTAWSFTTVNPPQPAWPGPARRDGWHKVDNLKPRVIFDWAYHVIVAEKNLYFGSSSDDKLYCLDEETGKERWSFFAEAPIRLAPTYHDGKIYFGSDDGHVYCVDAKTGDLVWKYRASEEDRRVPGNGRMMSLWPVRTGVLVDDGIAYFCSGLFPSEGVYLCAVNAKDGSEIWKHKNDSIPAQGYILLSSTKMYVPTGRGTPAVLNRKDGVFMQSLGGSGGTFALLTGDMLIYGPGKAGGLDAFKTDTRDDQLASFNGNQMIVTADRSYLHSDNDLTALDRQRHTSLLMERRDLSRKQEQIAKFLKSLGKNMDTEEGRDAKKDLEAVREQLQKVGEAIPKCVLWKMDCTYPYSLILADGILFAGGTGEVAAFDVETGEALWTQQVNGRALELAVANKQLYVSTDKGTIHCFK